MSSIGRYRWCRNTFLQRHSITWHLRSKISFSIQSFKIALFIFNLRLFKRGKDKNRQRISFMPFVNRVGSNVVGNERMRRKINEKWEISCFISLFYCRTKRRKLNGQTNLVGIQMDSHNFRFIISLFSALIFRRQTEMSRKQWDNENEMINESLGIENDVKKEYKKNSVKRRQKMHTANSASLSEWVDIPPVLFRLLRLCSRSAVCNDSCSSLSRLDKLTLIGGEKKEK